MRTQSEQPKLVEWALDTPALLQWLNAHDFFREIQIVNVWFTEPYDGNPHHVFLTLVFFHEALGAVPAPGFEFHPDALSPFLFPLSE